jgi:hypothetical protein
MVWFGVVGELGNLVVRMGWGYESTFVGGGGCFNATLDLTFVLVQYQVLGGYLVRRHVSQGCFSWSFQYCHQYGYVYCG